MSWHLVSIERAHQQEKDKVTITPEVYAQLLDGETSDGESKQDSDAVVALAVKALKEYAKNHPEVEEFYVRSDNAGCYHCQRSILSFWSMHDKIHGNAKIVEVFFSEPGKGKYVPGKNILS